MHTTICLAGAQQLRLLTAFLVAIVSFSSVVLAQSGYPSGVTNSAPSKLGGSPVNLVGPPINVVAVGYDIGGNPRAQAMLESVRQAANNSGATGVVIMADQDINALGNAMDQAVNIATVSTVSPAPVVQNQPWGLELKTPKVRSGEKIMVVHTDFKVEDKHAWIAFYEKAADHDEDYLSYTFLANLTGRTYDVVAPKKAGVEYHFRLFKSKAYDCAARSDPVSVER